MKQASYKINQGFITQKVRDKTTIFSGEKSLLFTLNDTAAFIFNGLKLNWSKEKIIIGLSKKYKVSTNEASQDLELFLSQLLEAKILVKK